jgi:hypothetical protein
LGWFNLKFLERLIAFRYRKEQGAANFVERYAPVLHPIVKRPGRDLITPFDRSPAHQGPLASIVNGNLFWRFYFVLFGSTMQSLAKHFASFQRKITPFKYVIKRCA